MNIERRNQAGKYREEGKTINEIAHLMGITGVSVGQYLESYYR